MTNLSGINSQTGYDIGDNWANATCTFFGCPNHIHKYYFNMLPLKPTNQIQWHEKSISLAMNYYKKAFHQIQC